MPPKKAPVPSLTTAEQMLLLIAARVDTAIRYMEANPGEDSGQFMERMAEEVVSNANYMFIHFRI